MAPRSGAIGGGVAGETAPSQGTRRGVLAGLASAGVAACGQDTAGVVDDVVVAVGADADLTLQSGLVIRLAGVEPPRAGDCPGGRRCALLATRFLQAQALGRVLTTIQAHGASDRWGRTPVIAGLGSVGDGNCLQREWIAAGLARVRPEPGMRGYVTGWLEAEAAARRARRGIWTYSGYQIRPAHAVRAYLHGFVIVQGVIEAVDWRRRNAILRFSGEGWWMARAVLSADVRADFGDPAIQGWLGRTVRVRGFLDATRAPAADFRVDEPGQITPVFAG